MVYEINMRLEERPLKTLVRVGYAAKLRTSNYQRVSLSLSLVQPLHAAREGFQKLILRLLERFLENLSRGDLQVGHGAIEGVSIMASFRIDTMLSDDPRWEKPGRRLPCRDLDWILP